MALFLQNNTNGLKFQGKYAKICQISQRPKKIILTMIKHVIKKSGEKEVFDEQKIKRGIMAAAKEAGLMEERIREVVNEVYEKLMMDIKDKEEVATQMIREKVLDALDKTEKSVADAWRKYEKSKHAC